MKLKTYECRPGSLPEDVIYDSLEDELLIIGQSEDEIESEFTSFFEDWHHVSKRKITNKGFSWSGSHPRYWRCMTDNEKRIYEARKRSRWR